MTELEKLQADLRLYKLMLAEEQYECDMQRNAKNAQWQRAEHAEIELKKLQKRLLQVTEERS